MNTYTLIKRDGTAEKRPFLLIDGKEMISEHIARLEFGEHDEHGQPRLEVPIVILEPLIQLFEAVRAEIGGPIRINSGYRSPAKQKELYDRDIREHGGKPSGEVARPDCAPHTYGAAMDLGIPAGWNAARLASLIRSTCETIGLPKARCGWRKYGSRFVHTDLVFLRFFPYVQKENQENPAPNAWKPGVTW